MKYCIECGAFVTRLVKRKLPVFAKSEEEAIEKAKDKFHELESNIAGSVGEGEINIDSITLLEVQHD